MYTLHTARSLARNCAAWAAVLALALSIAVAPSGSAQAEDISSVIFNTQTSPAAEVEVLRKLLCQPHLSETERGLLDRSLKKMSEEMADASESIEPSKGFVETINELLGVKRPKTTAHG